MNELMRALLAGAVVFSLVTACNAPSPEGQRDAELQERIAQDLKDWEQVQQIWRSKEQEGQGCEGKVLEGKELRDLVIGKGHIVMWGGVVPDPEKGPVESRNYYEDGTFSSSMTSDFFVSTYEINEPLLCTTVAGPSNAVESCFRLIRSSDGAIFEERLVVRGVSPELASAQSLTCIELNIAELEVEK